MRKQSLLIIALLTSSLIFAQKRELKDAEKALKSSNYAEARAELKAAEALMSEMDEDLKSKYYYLKAETLYAGGNGSFKDIQEARENLDKVTTDYLKEAGDFKIKMANELIQKGNDFYTKNDYNKASKYFEQSFRLSTTDTTFLYYAAATSLNAQDYDRALNLYEELRDLGYTGVQKEYYLTNKETGEKQVYDKNTFELYKKTKEYIKPEVRLAESKRPEIIKNIALMYINNGDNEKAITAIQDARKEDPNDVNLVLNEANIYLKTGDKEKFKDLLEKATQMDPTNPELYYNLGVVASQSNEQDQAKTYYEKAIELDPEYINAYINLSVLTLADEKLDAAQTLMNIYSILGETAKFKALKAKVAELESK